MCKIIEEMIDDLWKELENKPIIPRGSKRARQLLKNFDVREFFEDAR